MLYILFNSFKLGVLPIFLIVYDYSLIRNIILTSSIHKII